MAQWLVRNIDENLKDRLRRRARSPGQNLEATVPGHRAGCSGGQTGCGCRAAGNPNGGGVPDDRTGGGPSRGRPRDAGAADEPGRVPARLIVFDRGLAARRHHQGINIDFRDTAIAAIAIARGASLATRNRRHFADLELPLLDPWTD